MVLEGGATGDGRDGPATAFWLNPPLSDRGEEVAPGPVADVLLGDLAGGAGDARAPLSMELEVGGGGGGIVAVVDII